MKFFTTSNIRTVNSYFLRNLEKTISGNLQLILARARAYGTAVECGLHRRAAPTEGRRGARRRRRPRRQLRIPFRLLRPLQLRPRWPPLPLNRCSAGVRHRSRPRSLQQGRTEGAKPCLHSTEDQSKCTTWSRFPKYF